MAQPWYSRFFDGLYQRVLAAQFSAAQTRSQVALVRKLLRLRKGQRVLDVPCGMGRLTLPLAARGIQMTGLDYCRPYLARARRTARDARLDVRFKHGDMRDLPFESEFDAVFNWFGSFGYFSQRDNLRVAKAALRSLRPGGRYLVEGIHRTWLRSHFEPRDEVTIGGVRVVHVRKWNRDCTRLNDIWEMSAGRRQERHRISLRVYNGPEMRSLLREAGFEDVKMYGVRPLGPLSRRKARWIAVASRSV